MREMIAGARTSVQRDEPLVHANGSTIWVRMSAAVVTGPDGPSCLVLHLEDITRSRAAETAAREALTTLQAALLPTEILSSTGVTLAARYQPTAAHDRIGGDWYDTIALPAGGLALVIGDVEGHDLTAAAVMGLVRGAVRSYALEGHPPSVVVERVNSFLASTGIERLVTLAYVQLYPDSRIVTGVLVGHPAPMVVSADGTAAELLDIHPATGSPTC